MVERSAASTSGACMELLPAMIPASQADTSRGEPAACTIGSAERSRLQFVEDSNGVLYLRKIELLLLYIGSPPRSPGGPGTRLCEDAVQYLLPASAEVGIPGAIVCWFEPLLKGHTHTETIRVWGVIPPDGPTAALPDDVHCWELTQFLGPPLDREGATYVPCILD